MPFASVPFGALRRAAGEMIVADADVGRVADRIRRRILNLDFAPIILAGTLMRMSAPAIERARVSSNDMVEIYNTTVADLRVRYTPKTPAAPERGPLGDRWR